jgi:hypothetical protein
MRKVAINKHTMYGTLTRFIAARLVCVYKYKYYSSSSSCRHVVVAVVATVVVVVVLSSCRCLHHRCCSIGRIVIINNNNNTHLSDRRPFACRVYSHSLPSCFNNLSTLARPTHTALDLVGQIEMPHP